MLSLLLELLLGRDLGEIFPLGLGRVQERNGEDFLRGLRGTRFDYATEDAEGVACFGIVDAQPESVEKVPVLSDGVAAFENSPSVAGNEVDKRSYFFFESFV